MAQFNANIKLTVDEQEALRSVKKLESKIANTSFKINLRVNNLERTLQTVQQIQRAAASLQGTFRSISSPGGGDLGDAFGVAATQANKFFDAVSKGSKSGQTTAFAKTTAGVREQGQAFRVLAANIDATKPRFKDYIQGAEQASNISFARQLKELEALQDLYQKGITGQGSTNLQGQQAFEKLQNDLPTTKAGLLAVRSELERVQNLVDSRSTAGLGIAQNLLEVNKRLSDIDKDRLATLSSINAKQIQIANTVKQNVQKSAEGRTGSGFADFSRRAGSQTAIDKSIRRQNDRLKRTGQLQARIINDNADLQERKDFNAYKAKRRRIKRLAAQQKEADRKNAKLRENLALGAGFPLLFGAGPGGIAGGIAGAFASEDGFGLQILLSALGTRLDELGAATIKTAEELKDPLTNLSALNEKFNLFNRATTKSIERLQELGRAQEALNIIQGRVTDIIGSGGQANFELLASEAEIANKRIGELGLQLQAALAGPIGQFLRLVNATLGQSGNDFSNEPGRRDFQLRLSPQDSKELEKLKKESVKGIGVFDFAARNAAKEKVFTDFAEALKGDAKLSPEAALKNSQIVLSNAEKAESLRRRGIALERSVAQFRRSNEDTIYGFKQKIASIERQNLQLQQSVENRIFTQRQAIAKQESDNIRKQQQLDIDRQDLSLSGSKTFTNAPGEDLANSLSDAVRGYIKTRAEGEANLQQKERQFTIETLQLEKSQADFELRVQQKVEAIKRTITEYERSVTKYKLDTQIQISDLQRSAADYALEKAKERIRLESDAVKQQKMTADLAEMVRSGNYGGGSSPGSGMFPMTSPRGPRNLFGRSYHHGQDYATPMGTALSTKLVAKSPMLVQLAATENLLKSF